MNNLHFLECFRRMSFFIDQRNISDFIYLFIFMFCTLL